MPSVVIVGAQFGDEGKGKIIDYYSKDADIVVRFQGGCNAGHTVVVNNEKFKFHLIPSGVVYGKRLIIGNGVVLDLEVLEKEMDEIKSVGKKVNLLISDRAHVSLPFHRDLDGLEESFRGKTIGTTKRGVGPTYADKIARFGIRIVDLFDDHLLKEKLSFLIPMKSKILKNVFNSDAKISVNEVLHYCQKHREKIKQFVGDASIELQKAIKKKKKILFEGAQGTLLDIDHGTYPYVTSSNTTSGGALTGSGVGPKNINRIIGVTKGYITRVGEGPMPTELKSEVCLKIRQKGNEFGTTTGRPRRCGWLDAVILRYSIRINSIDALAVTKLDVLGGLKKIKICTAYTVDGKKIKDFPASLKTLEKSKPFYEEVDGWDDIPEKEWEKIAKKGYKALPKEMKNFIKRIERITGIPVYLISFGPGRESTISLKKIF